jgi:hypothetical protein
MRSSPNGWQFLELASRLGDMKEDQYRQLLAVSTLIELLVDKGFLTPDEIRAKASSLESELDRQLLL